MPLSNIPEDVYALFQDGIDKLPKEKVDALSTRIAEVVASRLEQCGKEYVNKPAAIYRMSNLGKGLRFLWFAYRDKNRFQIKSPKLKLLMLYGDIIEEILLFLIKEAGYEVEGEQDLLVLHGYKGGAKARGKRDAKINKVNSDIKSMSPFSFQKFKSQAFVRDPAADPFGYKDQAVSYAQADSDTSFKDSKDYAALIAMNKSNGELHVLNIDPLSQRDMRQRIDDITEAVNSEEMPERCYEDVADGKGGNRKLHNNCNMCKYKKDCWADTNDGKGLRTFLYSNGYRHLTHVEKLPAVEELKDKL